MTQILLAGGLGQLCIINSYSTLPNWPIVSLLILCYFISFCYILVHDYTQYFVGSPCCSVSYYNYIFVWPYYVVIRSMGYTPVLHVWNMCIIGVLHMYYRCMNYMCNTPKHNTCIGTFPSVYLSKHLLLNDTFPWDILLFPFNNNPCLSITHAIIVCQEVNVHIIERYAYKYAYNEGRFG